MLPAPNIATIGILLCGISWLITYAACINRGFRDKYPAMPFPALILNISWEFLFTFLFTEPIFPWQFQNILLQCFKAAAVAFDAVIVISYLKYGRRAFIRNLDLKYFYPVILFALSASFALIYSFTIEMKDIYGSYSAFLINILMSVLFILLLLRRSNLSGQSLYIAFFKMTGTLAPTLYVASFSPFLLFSGLICFFLDLVYIVMLYRKFISLGVNPFTRKAIRCISR
jgi:hypothetical protein